MAISHRMERGRYSWFAIFHANGKVREDSIDQFELQEGMEEEVIIPLLKYKILTETQSDLIIKDENILHLTFDNDTVEGTILFLMNENIAIKRPLPQGD